MHNLLILAASSALQLSPAVAAASIVAFLLTATQLLDACKGWWGAVLPPKYQWIPGTVIVAATTIEQAFANGVSSWTQVAVPFLMVVGLFLPGTHSAAVAATSRVAADLAVHPSLSDAERKNAQWKLVEAQRGTATAARLVGMAFLMRLALVALSCLALSGCNGTVAKDVESALSWIGRVTKYANDAAAYLDQNEAKIVELAPSSVRDGLQADLDRALADYRIAVGLTGDGAAITEDALAKNWAAFAADVEKLAADGAAAGLFKAPAAASSNAVPAGASPPPPPQDESPPLPLIVRHLKGQV